METADLNKKIELWGMADTLNELGELDRTPTKIKDLWVKIMPKHGSTESNGDKNLQQVKLNLIIRCRKLSVKNPSIDMFFVRESVKYKVVDYIEDIKNNQFWEFYCEVIYE